MNNRWYILVLAFQLCAFSFADEGESHKEGDEHHEGHDEEGSAAVGPDKGIIEAHDESGFKLSPEATKNFQLKMMTLKGPGPWAIPDTGMLLTLEEKNVYRLKDGFFKRLDLSSIARDKKIYKIKSSDLHEGDEVVIEGVGNLRMAEIIAFGGAPEGHSH